MTNHIPPQWIHSQLRKDCFWITTLPRAEVLLMNNAHWPWLILVPKGQNLREIQDMDRNLRAEIFEDANNAGLVLQKIYAPKKINTAALGNMVPQLHIHVIARFETDIAWPMPVWATKDRTEYPDPQSVIDRIRAEYNNIVLS